MQIEFALKTMRFGCETFRSFGLILIYVFTDLASKNFGEVEVTSDF